MGPSKMNFLSIGAIFHFHDCGRKGATCSLLLPSTWLHARMPSTDELFNTNKIHKYSISQKAACKGYKQKMSTPSNTKMSPFFFGLGVGVGKHPAKVFRFQPFRGSGARPQNPSDIETVQVPLFQSWAWEPGSKGLDTSTRWGKGTKGNGMEACKYKQTRMTPKLLTQDLSSYILYICTGKARVLCQAPWL